MAPTRPRHESPYPGPARPAPEPPARTGPPTPRAGARQAVAALLAAVVGGLVALGGAELTGSLGGGETRIVTVPSALEAPEPAPAPGVAGTEPSAGGTARPGATKSVQDIVRETAPAVVQVEVATSSGHRIGTGFVVDTTGVALTNAHVVEGAREVRVGFQDRSISPARVVGADPDTDLAVLAIEELPRGTRPVKLGRSGDLVVGDPVVAIGNPFGFEWTATTGIVSALGRRIEAPSGNRIGIANAIQTDAAINQGNSGGPLLDRRGLVVGINSQIFTRGGGSDGVGFAVPIDTVRPIARSIIATGRAQHAWIGITGVDLTAAAAAALRVPGGAGVAIVGVDERGPAAQAGLRPAGNPEAVIPRGADVIVAINGRRIEGMSDVVQEVASRPVGARIRLTVVRDGRTRQVALRLADRPDDVGRAG